MLSLLPRDNLLRFKSQINEELEGLLCYILTIK